MSDLQSRLICNHVWFCMSDLCACLICLHDLSALHVWFVCMSDLQLKTLTIFAGRVWLAKSDSDFTGHYYVYWKEKKSHHSENLCVLFIYYRNQLKINNMVFFGAASDDILLCHRFEQPNCTGLLANSHWSQWVSTSPERIDTHSQVSETVYFLKMFVFSSYEWCPG